MTRILILEVDIVLASSGVTFVLFCFVTTVCVLFFFFFGDVAFSEYFCTFTVFSLYGEYGVLYVFSLPGGVFLPCDHGLDLLHQLNVRIQ